MRQHVLAAAAFCCVHPLGQSARSVYAATAQIHHVHRCLMAIRNIAARSKTRQNDSSETTWDDDTDPKAAARLLNVEVHTGDLPM